MAHLLGNRFCIESLQKDVGDLQSVIIDIFSRTGSITSPSWKYPEKVSCDLDINDLLDRYGYSKDEEDCQVSHVILLELVIDRLVLVIQSLSSYTEQMLSMGRSASGKSISSNSIGLILKRYWNKMIQLHSSVQQLQSDNRTKSSQVNKLQDMVGTLPDDGEHPSAPDDVCEITDIKSNLKKKMPPPISIDYNCKSTQTYETAFIPCEACDGAQFCLKEAGKSISEMCESQSMKSNVWKICQKYQDSWMSVQDMKAWHTEQSKDLEQLTRHLNNLSGKLRETEERLENSQVQNSKYRTDTQTLKKELRQQKEDLTVTRKQYEKKLQDLRDKSNQAISEIERKNGELLKTEEALQVRIADLRCQLDQKATAISSLETGKQNLLDDLTRNKTDHQEVKKSQKYVDILEKELKELHGKLEESSRTAACLEVRNQSTNKQLDSLKTKQSDLFDQIENLEQENEDLKRELADLETEKEGLAETLEMSTNQLSSVQDDRSEFKTRIENLTREKNELTKRVNDLEDNLLNLELQVQKAKDQERLLIAYPDLNGPVDFPETGDVAQDMENQIRANSARINILQEENDGLKNSVRKILRTVNRSSSRIGSSVHNEHTKSFNTMPDPDNVPKLQLWR